MSMIIAHDGQQVHSSLIDALVAQEIQRQTAIAKEKQAEALRMARAETDMLRRTSRRYWRAQIMAARECYGYNPDPSPLARACAGLWGLIVYAVAVQWRRLMAAMGME
jgi:hypothetical protein